MRLQIDPGLFQPRPHYLLKVTGMSMKDAGILDGDLVAVHRTSEVRSRQIVVARLRRGHRQAVSSGRLHRVAAARESRLRTHQSRFKAGTAAHRRHRRGCRSQKQDERVSCDEPHFCPQRSGTPVWREAANRREPHEKFPCRQSTNWLGCSSIQPSGAAPAPLSEALATGFGSLDERLPGRGPRSGLIEILVPFFGVGELTLLPALAALTQRPMARWCVWVSPLEPFAPALAAHGIVLEHVLVARSVAVTSKSLFAAEEGANALWAFEQSLGSGACDLVMAWVQGPRSQQIRRLQLAAERGRTLGIL